MAVRCVGGRFRRVKGAQVRILGQQGDLVWAWAHDQPLALSARDGAVVADRVGVFTVQRHWGIDDLAHGADMLERHFLDTCA